MIGFIKPRSVFGWIVTDIMSEMPLLSAKEIAFSKYAFLHQDEAGAWQTPGATKSPGSKIVLATCYHEIDKAEGPLNRSSFYENRSQDKPGKDDWKNRSKRPSFSKSKKHWETGAKH